MRFVIDGDGSPVKNEVIKLSDIYQIPVLIVTSVDHYTTKEYSDLVRFIYVDKGADGADYRIVKEINNDDIVITQDYGLAALLLGKQTRIFHHSGTEYRLENIDMLLNQRFMGAKMRQAGKRTKGPKTFTAADRERFYKMMEQVLLQSKELET